MKRSAPSASAPHNPLTSISGLDIHGYAVFPILGEAERRQEAERFVEACRLFPEYKDATGPYVWGGFGAFGNPASFHNPFVRRWRKDMHRKAADVFMALHGMRNIEQLFDRMSWRRPGTATTAEGWHRDEAVGLADGDVVYGGWVNLDATDQHFVCAPGTHTDSEAGAGGGFAQIKREDWPAFEAKRVKVVVPPGHWIVFQQNIAHKVASVRPKADSLRIYFGWRVTDAEEPLFDLTRVFHEQGVPPLPSGQMPPMWPRMALSSKKAEMINWSARCFVAQCLEEKTGGRGDRYNLVQRTLPSLERLGLPTYAPYTDEERALHRPQLVS